MLHLGRGNLFVSGSGGLGIWVVVGFGVWWIALHFILVEMGEKRPRSKQGGGDPPKAKQGDGFEDEFESKKMGMSQYQKELISVHSTTVTYVSMTALITLCPAFVIFLYVT